MYGQTRRDLLQISASIGVLGGLGSIGELGRVLAARRLVLTRVTDTHDYKYLAAAFEDIQIVSPAWRPHMLAASVLHIPAATAPESVVIQRAKEAVAGL